MHQYPKNILTIQEQVQSYIDAGMNVPSEDEATNAMTTIGFYRLRGYCFQWYDNASKKYLPGTDFHNLLTLYQFDKELSHLLFSFTASIEVALRVRLTEALLLSHNDALILMDSAIFDDKKKYWQNMGMISGEITRSNDVFISMGKPLPSMDLAAKRFWRDNHRFADLFNAVFFHGEPVIDPDLLMERDTEVSASVQEKAHYEHVKKNPQI